jgi:hypothetical protein
MSKPHFALNWRVLPWRVLCWLAILGLLLALAKLLGAMRNRVILFDDTFGRSVIVWSAGLLQWSFSIDSRPAGRPWLTGGQAYRAARKAAGTMPTSGGKKL